MATNTSKLLCILFSLTFVVQGYGKCNIQKNVEIAQYDAWNSVRDIPTWETRVTNNCPCMVNEIKLSCRGFKSTTTVDSSKMKKSGDECLINDGYSLLPLQEFTFRHNWNMQFNFTILSAQILHCVK